MSIIDPKDTQPTRNEPERNRRMYVPATWKPAGTGAGAPKISGGFEIDKTTGAMCPRSLNRPDQRYNLPQTTLLARRQARAITEYVKEMVLLGENGIYEVRPLSGNNYDVDSTITKCDCPDWFRMTASGYGLVRCKHIYMVFLANSDPGLPNGPNWSCARWAECAGVEERTAQELCSNSFIPATMFNHVWIIDPVAGALACAAYQTRKVP